MNFIDIESVPAEVKGKVKQNLKFKTGKFVWRVKFSAPLDPSSINNMNLYVTNTSDVPLKTSIHYNSQTNEIEIEPLIQKYKRPGATGTGQDKTGGGMT